MQASAAGCDSWEPERRDDASVAACGACVTERAPPGCYAHVMMLTHSKFRGPEQRFIDERPARMSIEERLRLYREGKLDRHEVWTRLPRTPGAEEEGNEEGNKKYESRPMLDAAGILVRAVHDEMPEGLMRLKQTWRPVKRYLTEHSRKVDLCELFRAHYHSRPIPDRGEDEPMHGYLTRDLIVRGVRLLLDEIRTETKHFKPPVKGQHGGFRSSSTVEGDGWRTWEDGAVKSASVMVFLASGSGDRTPCPGIVPPDTSAPMRAERRSAWSWESV